MSLPQTQKYTYQDYLTWPDGERWEIIDGIAYNMTPAPSWEHQRIVLILASRIEAALTGKKCKAAIAPIDVVLSEQDVVQPDIIVVCDPKKTEGRDVRGAPDLVIEVLSPSTERIDRRRKKTLFERYGVREYILIDPISQYVEQYLLQENGTYDQGQDFDTHETMTIQLADNLQIAVWELFGLEKPSPPEPEQRG